MKKSKDAAKSGLIEKLPRKIYERERLTERQSFGGFSLRSWPRRLGAVQSGCYDDSDFEPKATA